MSEEEFLKRAIGVTKWFDALNPYDDYKPLFKIEDQNFRLESGKVLSGVHEPLHVIAISAKRYVLFNIGKDGKPIIRKAVAHGLGHWRAPYGEAEASSSIPLPSLPLNEIGVERWQYDLWYQVIVAQLDGHPDQVDLSPLPGLDRPAVSRYSAATPQLLRWFKAFNANKPYSEQVKPFNFLLAYQISKTALYGRIASGEIDADFLEDGLPAVVAPYDDDPVRAASKCFDRRTGRPIPITILTTYREVLADYHLHAESKFDNGQMSDRGVTERKHIQAVAIEYIGKEANRWEEQYFLGEMPEANVVYGFAPEARKQIISFLTVVANKHGKSDLAREAGITRQQLWDILRRKAEPRDATLRALLRAANALERAD